MKKIILWCVLCILLILGLTEANAIRRFSATSLRYTAPISGQAAYRSRQYAIDNPETFWSTFWSETTVPISTPYRETHTRAIKFSGDAALVWHAKYLTGSAPSSLDGNGIAVSEALAHNLWGSTDIVGMTVLVNEEERTVRGVFQGNTELALISFHIEDTFQSWNGAELSENLTRRDAESFALVSGLGIPDYILTCGVIALADFMSLFPFIIIGAYVLVTLAKFVRKQFSFSTQIFIAALIPVAVFLPFLLNALPPWLIPTYWSDFSFWSSLFSQAGDSVREFLSTPPTLRDVELRIHLLRQTGILFLSACCSALIVEQKNFL